MTDIAELLQRQSRWQRSRTSLSWPEKIRIAEGVREDVKGLRRREETAEKTEEPAQPLARTRA